MTRGALNLPKPCQFPDGGNFPYVIVGDEAFPLDQYRTL